MKFLFYIIIGVIIVFIFKNENNYLYDFKYTIFLIPLLNLLLFISYFSSIFPNGIKAQVNKNELRKFITLSIKFLLFSAFSMFIGNIFYKKSHDVFSSVSLGFCTGCIVWASISLIWKFYKNTTRVKLYENIFALSLLIIAYTYGIYSIEMQLVKGDKTPDLPYAFNILILLFHIIIKNFKSLFLYRKAKIDTKVKIIENSTYTIIIFLSCIFSLFESYKLIIFLFLVGIILFLAYPLIKPHIYNFLKSKKINQTMKI